MLRRMIRFAREQSEADGKEQVLKALDKAASSLRQKLGESLASGPAVCTPLEQAIHLIARCSERIQSRRS